MDKRVYILMTISFVAGMVELIIGGILDLIAQDLNVTLGQVGFLITIYSLILALAGPILWVLTAKIERKKITLIFLLLFLLGNIITLLSFSYFTLFVGRVVSALSASLLLNLCLVIAPSLVSHKYKSRAIGLISMGISGSIVLGLPIGLILGTTFNWRAPFILIIFLTVIAFIGVYMGLGEIKAKPFVPLIQQIGTLKDKKILFAQLTIFLFLCGHTVLYAYFTPYLKDILGFDGMMVSLAYLIFGVFAVIGGGMGGVMGDRIGVNKTMIIISVIFGTVILSINYTTFSYLLFLIALIIWGLLSFAITPPLQSYFINIAPETSDIQQSLNNSFLHLGIASGSFIGSFIIDIQSVEFNATLGGIIVLFAVVSVFISIKSKETKHNHNNLLEG